ncbi:transmembrane domain protein [Halobacterium phage phiH]|uniref:Transmembrane domain protein n=1 Tax=Halobacterium phage phiH TaxID=169684 RepID=A0A3G1ZKY1_BPPHH|nr:holin [Halobacterium phage phiH]AYM00339.1 transmembrane domain protein [Halobacterium phage phiH]
MIDTAFADIVGMIAGGVWLTGSIYFQMIREGDVHPAWISMLFLVGTALMMSSSAIALADRSEVIGLFGILANVLFLLLGIGVWYMLEWHVCTQEKKQVPDADSDAGVQRGS